MNNHHIDPVIHAQANSHVTDADAVADRQRSDKRYRVVIAANCSHHDVSPDSGEAMAHACTPPPTRDSPNKIHRFTVDFHPYLARSRRQVADAPGPEDHAISHRWSATAMQRRSIRRLRVCPRTSNIHG